VKGEQGVMGPPGGPGKRGMTGPEGPKGVPVREKNFESIFTLLIVE
jgi:hypothetical protein